MSTNKPVSVYCSDCDLELIQVSTSPISEDHEPLLWKIIAHCPKCGGKSYKKSFEGLFYMANGERTEISHDETINGIVHIYTALSK